LIEAKGRNFNIRISPQLDYNVRPVSNARSIPPAYKERDQMLFYFATDSNLVLSEIISKICIFSSN